MREQFQAQSRYCLKEMFWSTVCEGWYTLSSPSNSAWEMDFCIFKCFLCKSADGQLLVDGLSLLFRLFLYKSQSQHAVPLCCQPWNLLVELPRLLTTTVSVLLLQLCYYSSFESHDPERSWLPHLWCWHLKSSYMVQLRSITRLMGP